jgi:hypothetical protein
MQAYSYSHHSPLKPGDIRLFKLMPGRTGTELKGNLIVQPLRRLASEFPRLNDEAISAFEALSYTWGALNRPTDSIQILVNTEELYIPIHANLSAALRRLRHEAQPTFWWIDALCINQRDVAEKNVQLPLMPQIFESAIRVVVWLGEEYENSGAAISFLQDSLDAANFTEFLQEPTRKDAFTAVVHLMKRPWFTRRWVIQEISSARRAFLYCGAARMPWHAFVDAISLIAAQKDSLRKAFSPLLANDPDDVESFNSLSTLKFLHLVDNMFRKTVNGRITEHLMTLEALLATTPQFESTDPKDTVYALLFLASDAEATTYEDWLRRFRLKHAGRSWDQSVQSATGLLTQNGRPDIDDLKDDLKRHYGDISPHVEEPHRKKVKTSERIKTYEAAKSKPQMFVQTLGYALVRYLGLEAYGNRRAIMVDYKKSILEICRDLMKFVITHSESIDMLCRPWAPPDMNLPSWVRTKAESAHLPGLNGVYRRVNADPLVGNPLTPIKPYMASARSKATWSQQARDQRNLVLQGFVLDRIKTKDAIATAGIVPMTWTKMGGWTSLDETPPEIFWRTLVGNRNASGQRAPFHWGQVCTAAFTRRAVGQDLDTGEAIRHGCPDTVRAFLERVQSVVWSRRLIRFDRLDTLGLAPRSAKKSDLLCILKGCSVPVVLREFIDGSRAASRGCPDPLGHFSSVSPTDVAERQPRVYYEFIGEAYVHGIMDGEAYDHKHAWNIPPHSFLLR